MPPKFVLALPLPILRWPQWRRAAKPDVEHSRLGEAELRGMSDYELKDLGIGRSEVPGVLEAEVLRRR